MADTESPRADVDVAAHRDSYPMGNNHHGTPENPNWGTFCVECKQSWPCDVSILAAECDDLRARLAERDQQVVDAARDLGTTRARLLAVETLAEAAEAREATSLSRTFDGGSFGAWVDARDLRAVLASPSTHTRGEDTP
jgi:hypothetical protein